MTDEQILSALRDFDTPSITNVVATYPDHPLCLGLYHPWHMNWYTDQSIHCMYPNMKPVAGYAVTCIYGLPDSSFNRLSLMDIIEALDASPKPTILVIEQRFPPEIAGKVGLSGGNMTTAIKAVGGIGVISNGPSRDIDEIRDMDIQYLLSGISPGHGPMAVHAVNVPVHVAGMDVAPGDIIHMDENGAVKFPAQHLDAVMRNVTALREEETTRMAALRRATNAAEVRAAFTGHTYTTSK